MIQSEETTAELFAKDLEVDDDYGSVSGDSIGTDTTSLSSTVLEHVYENGRRYHNVCLSLSLL